MKFLRFIRDFIVRVVTFSKVSPMALVRNSKIDKTAAICSSTRVYDSQVGKYTYVGRKSTLCSVKIGNFCSVSGGVIIGGGSHPLEWVGTSSAFHQGKNILRKNFSEHPYAVYKSTTIGNDVWIGNNVRIKAGVTIGDGAVIGMGAILTKNVGPYEIWAGNPAKFIRKRFDDEIIEKLLQTKWWEFSDEQLFEYAQYFNCPEQFLKQVNLK